MVPGRSAGSGLATCLTVNGADQSYARVCVALQAGAVRLRACWAGGRKRWRPGTSCFWHADHAQNTVRFKRQQIDIPVRRQP